MLISFILMNAGIGLWTLIDTRRRKESNWLPISIFSTLIWPLILPVYLGRRNLKEGEVRKGGPGWNAARNLMVALTLGTGAAVLRACSFAVQGDESRAWPWTLLAIAVWFCGMFVLILIGEHVRQRDLIERGPTGALAD